MEQNFDNNNVEMSNLQKEQDSKKKSIVKHKEARPEHVPPRQGSEGFDRLPRVIKEEIFCWVGDSKEIAKLRLVCHDFKYIIDKSQRPKIAEKFQDKKRYKEIDDVCAQSESLNMMYFAGECMRCNMIGFGLLLWPCIRCCEPDARPAIVQYP